MCLGHDEERSKLCVICLTRATRPLNDTLGSLVEEFAISGYQISDGFQEIQFHKKIISVRQLFGDAILQNM